VRAVPDVVAIAGAAEVLSRGDPTLQVGVRVVDAGVDDRDAHPRAGEAGGMERRDMEQGDRVVQQRLDRERRPGRDADRPERIGERRLPVGRDVDDDDVRAPVGLPDGRTEVGEEVSGDAGVRGVRRGAFGIAGRELRCGDATHGLDDQSGREGFRVRRGRSVRRQHSNQILTPPVKTP